MWRILRYIILLSVAGWCAVLPAQVDINLGASYAFLDWLSAFVKVNNLINSKYQLWAGYEAQGFNVMAGAAFSF